MLNTEETRLLNFLNVSTIGVKEVKTKMTANGCEVIITKLGTKKKFKIIQMSKKQCEDFALVMKGFDSSEV